MLLAGCGGNVVCQMFRDGPAAPLKQGELPAEEPPPLVFVLLNQASGRLSEIRDGVTEIVVQRGFDPVPGPMMDRFVVERNREQLPAQLQKRALAFVVGQVQRNVESLVSIFERERIISLQVRPRREEEQDF